MLVFRRPNASAQLFAGGKYGMQEDQFLSSGKQDIL